VAEGAVFVSLFLETTRVPGKFTVAALSIIAAFIAATPCCGFEHC
jgi:hypothetical protein